MTRRLAAASPWVLVGLGCLVPVPASAQTTPCAEPIEAWVAEASGAIDVEAEAVSCPPGLARVRLHPEGTAPIDVEVAEPPGPAFRHAGRLRTSPIVEVNDYAELPAPQSEAYEGLVGWLEAHETRVVLRVAPSEVVRGAPAVEGIGFTYVGWWLVAAALVLVALGLWRDRPRTVDWKPAAAATAIAGVVRAGFGVWGPHHVNGQGPLWIRGALGDPGLLASYGPGYAELLGPVARAFPFAPATAVFAANAALGSVACALVYWVARGTGIERNRALFAALLLALAPPAVRFAASEAYFTPIAALVLGATLAVVLGSRSLRRRRWLAASALLVGAGLLAAQAARIHPSAWIGVALVPLAGLLPAAHPTVRVQCALAAAAIVAGASWLTSGGWVAAVLSTFASSEGGPSLADPVLGGTAVRDGGIALLLAAAALVVARPGVPVVVGVVHAVVALATWRIYGQSTAWAASYVTLYLPLAAVGLATILPRDVGLLPSLGLPVVTAGATLMVLAPHLLEPTTEQLEHAFLKRELASLDPACRLAYLERAGQRLLVPPSWAHRGSEAPLRVQRPDDLATGMARTCVYWLHTSICTSEEARGRCRAIERAVALEPVAHTRLPARPSYDGLPYDEEQVEVAVHRVVPRR